MAKPAKPKKRGATPKTEKQKAISGWMWLITGLLIGLFIAFLVFLKGQPQVPEESSSPKVEQKQVPSPEGRTFDYDFYKLLPRLEVVVPENKVESKTKSGEKASPVEKPGVYVLQAGSFRKHADADRRKANLALLGVASQIVSVKVEGVSWHRIQIGPFEDLKRLNETRDLLIDNNIETLLLKARG